jgi:hypothetical protein
MWGRLTPLLSVPLFGQIEKSHKLSAQRSEAKDLHLFLFKEIMQMLRSA